MGRLTELAQKYNSDKLHAHSYLPFYEEWLEPRLGRIRKMVEIGIGYRDLMTPFVPEYTPASGLQMWREYFPIETKIWVVDISLEAISEAIKLNLANVAVLKRDQSRISDLHELITSTGGELDLVIDDGSHEVEHQILTAKTLMPYVARGGVYVIEDVRDPHRVASAIGGAVFSNGKRPDDNLVVRFH